MRLRCDACGRVIKAANELGLCTSCEMDEQMLSEDEYTDPWGDDD